MRISILCAFGLAILTVFAVLAATASAECTTCKQEGNWSESAQNFIEGKATNEDPIAFGPKAARQTTSQFEKEDQASASDAAAEIILKSINATPSDAVESSPVKVTAVFGLSGETDDENATTLDISATASIKDSTGNEVSKLILVKTGANEYSKEWIASTPGVYSVDIAATSLDGSASFANCLQIVVSSASGNATESATASTQAQA